MLTLYTKENCSYCTQAKAHLDRLGFEYKSLMLDVDFTRENLLDIYPQAKTFPVIIDEDGTFIGGYSQLVVHEKYSRSIDE